MDSGIYCNASIKIHSTTKAFHRIEKATRIKVKNTGLGTIHIRTKGSNDSWSIEENQEEILHDNVAKTFTGSINISYDDSESGQVKFLINY